MAQGAARCAAVCGAAAVFPRGAGSTRQRAPVTGEAYQHSKPFPGTRSHGMLADAGSGDPETPISPIRSNPRRSAQRTVIMTRPVHERFNNADL